MNQISTKIFRQNRNTVVLVTFLLLITAFCSNVYAQTFQQGETIPQQPQTGIGDVPSQEPHPAVSGGVDYSSYWILFFIVLALIIIIIVIVRHSNKKESKLQNIPQPQQTLEKSIVICPNCYNRIDADNDFCPKCGADLRPKTIQ